MHRLTNLGAVVTYARARDVARGLRGRVAGDQSSTVDGDLVNRVEIFDEADIDAALARFEQLSHPAPRLENAASRVYERYWACFAARDWDAMAERCCRRHSARIAGGS